MIIHTRYLINQCRPLTHANPSQSQPYKLNPYYPAPYYPYFYGVFIRPEPP